MGSWFSKRKLSKLDVGDVPPFTFRSPKKYHCRVCEVYDGDTITLIMKFRGKYEKFKVRMAGYDSPEMKPPLSDPNRQKEIAAAIQARDVLKTMILDKVVDGECHGTDKYGRLIMTIFYKGRNINQTMIDCGYGLPYDGGKKRGFSSGDWNPTPPARL